MENIMSHIALAQAKIKRNRLWKNNKRIPSWVNIEQVDFDQFFTKKDVAIKLYSELMHYIIKDKGSLDDCLFVEPAAGAGSFFDLLPHDKRIGLDIYPIKSCIVQDDFLSWELPKEHHGKTIVFVGNPPFGYRAWLALAFMNHAASFADYIGFILPMSFQSDGKGSPKNRVVGMSMKSMSILGSDSFLLPDDKPYKVNALWQIWKKGETVKTKVASCDEYIELFTVDERKERLCGQEKKKNAHYFLQRTYFNKQPTIVKDFSKVKYVCGYGIIIKKDKAKVVAALKSVDWDKYSNLAAHNCRHISMYHIIRALTDRKVVDRG